jgi:hypothetical protein
MTPQTAAIISAFLAAFFGVLVWLGSLAFVVWLVVTIAKWTWGA